VLAAHGLRPRKRLGQNFLVDPRLAQRIAEALPAGSFVLEVGGGIGALTAPLARAARQLEVVEVDRGLAQILRERFARDAEQVKIIEGDILDLDLRAALEAKHPPRAICGNLPYSITTPLIERIVEAADAWECALLMVQREYAKRLTARPGTPDYGSLTVFVAHFCDVESLFTAGAAGFYPAPNVASSVVKLQPRRSLDSATDDALLLWIIRAAFAQRRKTLANSIAGQPGAPAHHDLAASIRAAGLPADIRGERLALSDFERLTNALRAQGFRAPVR